MSRYSLKKTPHDEGAVQEKAPQGFFTFEITDHREKNKDGTDKVTKNGDPKLLLFCEIAEGEHIGKRVFHNLIYYQPDSPSVKGIGMTRHFLKCVGENWEGDLKTNPDDLIGKRFKAEHIHGDPFDNLVDIQPAEQNADHPTAMANNSTTSAAEEGKEVEWDSE